MPSPLFRAALAAAALVCLAACGAGAGSQAAPAPSGPPQVEPSAVARQAEAFDRQLPQRLAGSQEEFAASSYLLAHLQAAGYVVQLDSVPFRNDVNSTNVVALPPSGGAPTVVVAVPYGTGPGNPSDGVALGTFIELARALNVAFPNNSVEFVALGAEYTDVNGGHLGSRRLAQVLLDHHQHPLVVLFQVTGGGFAAYPQDGGAIDVAHELDHIAGGARTRTQELVKVQPPVFSDARLSTVLARGRAAQLGRVLLRFLTSPAALPPSSPTS
jgi:hypothetical protein